MTNETNRLIHYDGTSALLLQKYLEELRNCNLVLDFGCGTGNFLHLCAEHGINAEGFDANPSAVEICREKGYTCSAEMPDLEKYDGLLLVCVIEHLQQDDLWNLLSSFSGRVLIHSDEPRHIWTPFGLKTASFWDDYEHVRPYTPKALESMLKHFGYDIIGQGRARYPRSIHHLRTWLNEKYLDLTFRAWGIGGSHYIVGEKNR